MRSRLARPGDRTLRAAVTPRPIGRMLLAAALLLGVVGVVLVDVTTTAPATRPTASTAAGRPATPPAAPSSTPAPPSGLRDLGLTATALTGRHAHQVRDHVFRATTARGLQARTATTATASSTCRGCTADSAALQVLFLRRAPQVSVDNVATAWSRCHHCQATALSVQVVLTGTPHPQVATSNQALAPHRSCTRCRTASAAFQVVVSGVPAPLSPAALSQLRQWFREQAASLGSEGTGSRALRQLVAIVRDGAPGLVVRRTVSRNIG
ncbi:MAG TPA: hypothetical protein VFT75_18750 [Nocardioidaceae bacterium]|nr:hypothetical protein [Nocardioidaceae bacterium]